MFRYSSHAVQPADEGISGLALELEAWNPPAPLSDEELMPLPHVILLHLTYHLTVIFGHRPSYRGPSGLSARKCDVAASEALKLVMVSVFEYQPAPFTTDELVSDKTVI